MISVWGWWGLRVMGVEGDVPMDGVNPISSAAADWQSLSFRGRERNDLKTVASSFRKIRGGWRRSGTGHGTLRDVPATPGHYFFILFFGRLPELQIGVITVTVSFLSSFPPFPFIFVVTRHILWCASVVVWRSLWNSTQNPTPVCSFWWFRLCRRDGSLVPWRFLFLASARSVKLAPVRTHPLTAVRKIRTW